ncbi:MAG: hypothetical protein JST85_23520 [Acidobacteria bacterium]|nr:hypothetical protein [Acidobacteriota bacterium]
MNPHAICNSQWNSLNNFAGHKLHLSVAQLDYNQKSQSVEIVLRVYGDDLENAISQHAKRPIKIDPATANKDKRIGQAILAYLRNSFELKSPSGTPVKLNWLGMESQTDMFWLHVEGKMPAVPASDNGLDGAQLKNRIFCEQFADQVNIVNTKIRGKQVGLMFEAKDGFKMITAGSISNRLSN